MPRTVSRERERYLPFAEDSERVKVGIGEAAADDRDVDGELVRCHMVPAADRFEELRHHQVSAGRTF